MERFVRTGKTHSRNDWKTTPNTICFSPGHYFSALGRPPASVRLLLTELRQETFGGAGTAVIRSISHTAGLPLFRRGFSREIVTQNRQ